MDFYSFYPSGNPTILVAEPILGDRIALAKYLLVSQAVEQVGFVSAAKLRLHMMGNEFCLNATRSFGVWLYQQQGVALPIWGHPREQGAQGKQNSQEKQASQEKQGDQENQGFQANQASQAEQNTQANQASQEKQGRQGEQKEQGWYEWQVEVSGCTCPVVVQVRLQGGDFESKVLMDVEQAICEPLALGLNLVTLPGITHVVLDTAYFPMPKKQGQGQDQSQAEQGLEGGLEGQGLAGQGLEGQGLAEQRLAEQGLVAQEEALTQVRQLLHKYKLWNLPAAGCIWVEQVQDYFKLTPFVYVRDTATIYAETACGSGTLAAALVQGSASGGGGSGRRGKRELAEGEMLQFKQPSQEMLVVQKASSQAYWVGGKVKFLGQGQCNPMQA